MADGDAGGASKAGLITLLTALVTAGGAIAVAYINRSPAAPELRERPQAAPLVSSGGESIPAPAPLPVANTSPAASIPNVAGQWRDREGEVLAIDQTGSQLGVVLTAAPSAGNFTMQGRGQISGRFVSWTVVGTIQGQQIEGECRTQLTSDGQSLQGTCSALGRESPAFYTR